MDTIIGRSAEKKILKEIRQSQEAEFLAVYGRRRVGKTFLIHEYFKNDELYFELTGLQHGKLHEQLSNFADVFSRTFLKNIPAFVPESWQKAFNILRTTIESETRKGKIVLFFDELPWLASARSGFLQALGYFWNSWASKQKNLILIICGSAASWMLQKVIYDKGGLHNRVTRRIRLMPFSLMETEKFLKSRSIKLQRSQILEIYMIMGGIPLYLKQIQSNKSSIQNINDICFLPDGFLYDEFNRLYSSLFDNYETHIKIIKALSKKRSGLTRNELIKQAELTSGGTTSQIIDALIESGFIAQYVPFGKKKNDTIFRLIDEYSLFYLHWIEKVKPKNRNIPDQNIWLQLCKTPSWSSWSGFAFEEVCWKHVYNIKKALGISGIYSEASTWRFIQSDSNQQGCQIDLLIDRSDDCVTICEIKYNRTPFSINKSYATKLQQKMETFQIVTATKKTLFMTVISAYGLKENSYSNQLLSNYFDFNILFQE